MYTHVSWVNQIISQKYNQNWIRREDDHEFSEYLQCTQFYSVYYMFCCMHEDTNVWSCLLWLPMSSPMNFRWLGIYVPVHDGSLFFHYTMFPYTLFCKNYRILSQWAFLYIFVTYRIVSNTIIIIHDNYVIRHIRR